MEHIVQFGISIDDDAIARRINESAYKDVCKDLMNEAIRHLPTKSFYSASAKNPSDIDWKNVMNNQIKDFLQENKECIIEAAAKELAASTKRSKAYKEKMKEVTD